MYNEELEKLIDEFISDGKISDTEKKVLLKKSKSLGIDKEEFEEVLNSKLRNLEINQNISSKLNKCPACGDILAPMSKICSHCGAIINEEEGLNNLNYLTKSIERTLLKIQSINDKLFLKTLKYSCPFLLGALSFAFFLFADARGFTKILEVIA